MHTYCSAHSRCNLRGLGRRISQAAALAMILAMAVPAFATARAVKSKVPPVYPAIAKRMKIEGAVRLIATVDPKGKVTDVKEVSGNHILALAAEDAVRQWRFVPGTDMSSVDVLIDFTLNP